jgi:hypothetical protein
MWVKGSSVRAAPTIKAAMPISQVCNARGNARITSGLCVAAQSKNPDRAGPDDFGIPYDKGAEPALPNDTKRILVDDPRGLA